MDARRPPNGDRLTRVEDQTADLRDRMNKIEPFTYWAVYGAGGVGFVVGLFAKQVAHVLFGV